MTDRDRQRDRQRQRQTETERETGTDRDRERDRDRQRQRQTETERTERETETESETERRQNKTSVVSHTRFERKHKLEEEYPSTLQANKQKKNYVSSRQKYLTLRLKSPGVFCEGRMRKEP